MKLSLPARAKHALFTLAYLCLIAGLAWLTASFPLRQDLTASNNNSLSIATQKLLDTIPDPVQITAYIKKGMSLRLQITQLISRYQQYKPNIGFRFIDPDSQPEQARELAIGEQGAVTVAYQGRIETLSYLDETTLTNALLQLVNSQQRWLSFLTGHGERSPEGIANFDLGQFGKELARRKITAINLNLSTVTAIPDNSALLVIAAPAVPLLAGEIELIKHYLQRGGNLLLMTDPGNQHLKPLLDYIGIQQLPGTIADTGGKLYGLDNPGFVIADHYPTHPVTRGLQLITVYPATAALTTDKTGNFKTQALLESSGKTWLETGAMTGAIAFDRNERQGPLTFGYALSRSPNKTEQRIIVIGDSDFLANTYIGNVGNMDMGLRMVNWLIHDDRFIDIPAKTAGDKALQLSTTAVSLMGFGFLLVLPFLLLVSGIFVWQVRRRK